MAIHQPATFLSAEDILAIYISNCHHDDCYTYKQGCSQDATPSKGLVSTHEAQQEQVEVTLDGILHGDVETVHLRSSRHAGVGPTATGRQCSGPLLLVSSNMDFS